MARIRTIKPEILEDEKTAPLSDSAFRLFAAMIFLADDHGNVRADSRWLQAQIWWAHRSPPPTESLLLEVVTASLANAYVVRSGIYAHICGWEKHQRIDNAGKNRVPPPNDADALPYSFGDDVSRNSSERFGEIPLDPDHRPPTTEGDPDVGRRGEPPLAKLKAKADKAPSTRRVHPLPSDWSPRSDERVKAVADGLDCDREAEAFRDHHAAKGSRMTDWDAAFRTWLRNAVKFASVRGPQRGGRSQLELQADRVRMLEEQEGGAA